MSLSSKARPQRLLTIAALALAATAAGCKKDSLLQVTDPDILNTGRLHDAGRRDAAPRRRHRQLHVARSTAARIRS